MKPLSKIFLSLIAIILSIFLFNTVLFAEHEDIRGVRFKNGRIIYGKVMEINSDKITIAAKDGQIITEKFDEVEAFIRDGAPVSSASRPVASSQSINRITTKDATFNERVSAEIYGGYLQGRSRELVYDAATGQKVSELIWSIDNAFVVGGSVAVRPFNRLKISVGGWVPVSSSNTMDDYDWQVSGFNDWSDWSHHPDTKLHHAYMIDGRIAFTLASAERASLDLLGGYRWFKMSWTAYNGSYIYSTSSIRDTVGQFAAGQPGISYEQWWETPYVGLGGSIGVERWTVSAEVIGSLWAKGRDRDDHHMRTLLFEESFSRVAMMAANVGVNYNLTQHFSVFARFDYEEFFEGKGPTTMTNYSTGAVQTFGGDAAGADFRATMFSLGLKMNF